LAPAEALLDARVRAAISIFAKVDSAGEIAHPSA